MIARPGTLRNLAKRFLKLLLWPRLLPLELKYRVAGIETVSEKLVSYTIGVREILTHFGATIGPECVIHGPIIIHNAVDDYSNLIIGRNVHIGRGVFLDLVERIVIEDESVISMNCTLLTHQNVKGHALEIRHPSKRHPLRIGTGAFLGANVVLLAGCNVGAYTTVGAGAVVTQSLPDNVTAVGVPARIIKRHNRLGGR